MPHPLRPLLFLLVPLCALSQDFSHGTSTAAIRTETQIVIASDSRVVDENDKILPDTCKIRSAGRWHFSLIGMSSTTGMEAFGIVGKALDSPGDLTNKFKAISDALTPLLNTALRSNAKLREHVAADGGSVLGVIIFGYEQGRLKLAHLKFLLADSGLVYQENHTCPGDCPFPNNRAGVFAPAIDAQRFDWNAPPLTAARSFVQMEIDRKAVAIGPPIQILRINRNGESKWKEKPQVCKDQQ